MKSTSEAQLASFPKRVLTGDRPTGRLHVGHLFGSLQSRLALQDEYAGEMFVMIADVQGLTDHFKQPQTIRDNVREVLLDNLAVGLDPTKVTFFIQSQVPEIAELTVLFMNLVSVARLSRNPTVKTEIAQKQELFGKSVTLGFLAYPVSQAADITFARASVVPVGEDQLPMIEQTREIVKRFNTLYGETLPIPEALIGRGRRILGLDGAAKMSKSLGNAVYLGDDEAAIRDAFKRAKTDSGREIVSNPQEKPEITNLITLYSLATGRSVSETEEEFRGASYADFKQRLGDEFVSFLQPIRERRSELANDPDMLDDVLAQGLTRAKAEAAATMALVRERVGIDYSF
jgi:tryptophanyl-tRNA synthetase